MTGRRRGRRTLDGSEGSAKKLYVHPNTVRTRLRRIADRTGRSLTDPRGITELALALRAVRQAPRPPTPEPTDAARKP